LQPETSIYKVPYSAKKLTLTIQRFLDEEKNSRAIALLFLENSLSDVMQHVLPKHWLVESTGALV